MLALETMENDLMDSISKAKRYVDSIQSPWPEDLSRYRESLRDRAGYRTGVPARHAGRRFHPSSRTPCRASCGISRLARGNVDFVSFFRLLQRENYSGLFVTEMWSDETPHSIEVAKDARAFISDKISRAQKTEQRLDTASAGEGNDEEDRD